MLMPDKSSYLTALIDAPENNEWKDLPILSTCSDRYAQGKFHVRGHCGVQLIIPKLLSSP